MDFLVFIWQTYSFFWRCSSVKSNLLFPQFKRRLLQPASSAFNSKCEQRLLSPQTYWSFQTHHILLNIIMLLVDTWEIWWKFQDTLNITANATPASMLLFLTTSFFSSLLPTPTTRVSSHIWLSQRCFLRRSCRQIDLIISSFADHVI